MRVWMANLYRPRVTPLIKTLALTLGLLCGSSVWAQSQSTESSDVKPPFEMTSYQAVYNAYRTRSKLGTAEQTFTSLGDNRYRLYYKSDLSLLFLSDKREETSEFTYTDGELLPVDYRYRRTGTGSDKHLHVAFNTSEKQMHFDSKEVKPWQGELDNQIYIVLVKEALASGQQQTRYKMINSRGQYREYGLEILGKETLTLPYGEIESIKTKVIRDSTKRETFIWFAPKLDYVMVRLQQFKKGKQQGDIKLQSFKRLADSQEKESTEEAG